MGRIILMKTRPTCFFKDDEYGISHYRQIAKEDLKRIDDDVTRNSVQKAVVVICKHQPNTSYLFGPLAKKFKLLQKHILKNVIFLILVSYKNYMNN